MDDLVVVLVADDDDPGHTRTSVFHSVEQAENHIQSLIQNGIGQSRLRVFAASDMRVDIEIVVNLAPAQNHDAEIAAEESADQESADQETADQEIASPKLSNVFRPAY
jgi:hypothetical protein